MIKWTLDNRTFWGAVGVLTFFTLIMGVRARSTVATVLSPERTVNSYETEGYNELHGDIAAVRMLDSLLVTAVPGDRDPFEFLKMWRPPTTKKVVKEKDVIPVLRTLLYDNVDPGVRINIGSRTSGWLHVGDSFDGWTVDEITADSVEISNGTRRERLSAK